MKPTPSGWPRFSSALVYRDAAAALDWLCANFGFEVRLKVEDGDGGIAHCELAYGDGLIMLAQQRETSASWRGALRSPLSVQGANTQSLMVYVDDVDAHCARARAGGARVVEEPAVHDYGEGYWADRSYGVLDLEGHLWWISQRLRG